MISKLQGMRPISHSRRAPANIRVGPNAETIRISGALLTKLIPGFDPRQKYQLTCFVQGDSILIMKYRPGIDEPDCAVTTYATRGTAYSQYISARSIVKALQLEIQDVANREFPATVERGAIVFQMAPIPRKVA